MLKKLKIKNSLTEQYSSRLIKVIKTDKDREINLLYNKIFKAWKKNKTVYVCGNGGSAGNANHIANDLIQYIMKMNTDIIKVEKETKQKYKDVINKINEYTEWIDEGHKDSGGHNSMFIGTMEENAFNDFLRFK